VAGGEEEEPDDRRGDVGADRGDAGNLRESEPERMARQESVRANNALAIALYGLMQLFQKAVDHVR
jgi:hypothetical protein